MAEWPKKVRVKMRPDEEVEVGEKEYIDLERQGLLVDQEEKDTGEAAPATRSRQRAGTDDKE